MSSAPSSIDLTSSSARTPANQSPSAVGFAEALRFWLKLGFVSFGGPAGIKPAVTALVLHAAHRMGSRALNNAWMWSIAAAAFVAIFALHAPFPAIVLAAALIGHFGAKVAPHVFTLGGGPGRVQKSYGLALIDDDTPPPAHAQFRRNRLLSVLAVGLGLWAVAMAWLVATQGVQGTLTQMGWFFTKAAIAHLRWRLRRAALCVPGRRRAATSWLQPCADDRWPGAGRDHARPA
jgi:hypothetical protein